jgi:hypothetical protein
LPCTPSWSTASGVGRRPGRSVPSPLLPQAP